MQKVKSNIYNFLRWSEKYTKTDMVYLAKGGFWLTLGQTISSFAVFILAIAFANLLPKETYGQYKYILSIVGILSIATLLGMATSMTQSVARGYEKLFLPAIKTQIRWGLLGGGASLVLSAYYFFNDNTLLSVSFLVSAFFIPFMDSFSLYGSLLSGKKRFGRLATYTSITQILVVLAIITSIFFTDYLPLILLTYLLSWTIMRFVFFKITLKKFPLNDKEDPDVLTYGKHLSFMKSLSLVSNSLSNIFLFHFLGGSALAVFYFAVAPIEQVRGLMGTGITLIFPKISDDTWKIPSLKEFIYKIFPLFGILFLFIILYITIAPSFFNILFPKYTDSILLSQILAISLFFTAFNILFINILKAKKRTPVLHKLNILEIALNFLVILPAIYYWGVFGFAYAIILNKIISMIVMGSILFGSSISKK